MSQKENKRSKNCYVMINLENDDMYIAKDWNLLYKTLETNGVPELMISNKSIDFSKKNNLKNYADSCLNYDVKKLALRP